MSSGLSRLGTALPAAAVGWLLAQKNTRVSEEPSTPFVQAAQSLLVPTEDLECSSGRPSVLKGLPDFVISGKKYAAGTTPASLLPNLIGLGLNENPVPGVEGNLHRYPERDNKTLVDTLQAVYSHVQWQEKSVGMIVGPGSSYFIELIAMLASKLCVNPLAVNQQESAPNQVVFSQRSYGAYPSIVEKHGLKYQKIANAKDDAHDLQGLLDGIDGNTHLVLIDNPCNPTGTFLDTQSIDHFMRGLKKKRGDDSVWVVLDEAYIEFAELELLPEQRNQSLKLLEKYPNLIILRTASKYYALASMRCGYAMGQKTLLEQVDKFISACPISVPTQERFQAALLEPAKLEANGKNLVKNRDALIQRVLDSGVLPLERISNSDASFVLFKLPQTVEAENVARLLFSQSPPTAVRVFGDNVLRMSVISDAKQMEVAGNALVDILGQLQAEQGNASKASNVQAAAASPAA